MSQLTIDRPSTLVLAPSRPTLTGVQEWAEGLEELERSNVLLIVYEHGPGAVRDAWHERVEGTPARLGVLGVGVPDHETDGEPVSDAGTDVLTTVRDPADASDLGVAISLYLQDWSTDDAPTVLGFHSLTAMLDHVGVETTFRFLHLLNRRLADARASGQFYLDPAAVDERTIETLRPVFDSVVERDRSADDRLSPDVAFDLVRAARRRYVLYHLLENPGGTSIERLVAAVARREETPDRERIETSLRHAHLPKLADAGLVALESDRLVPRRSLAAIEPYLSPAAGHDLPDEERPF